MILLLLPALALSRSAHAEDAPPEYPEVNSLGVSPALSYPIERTPFSLSSPATVIDSDTLEKWDYIRPGFSLSNLDIAHPAGNDADGVPSRLGLSLLGMPASGTVYTVEGIRVASDRDAIGTNLNLIPFPMIDRLEVFVGPASDCVGSGATGGTVNAVLPGGIIDTRTVFETSVTGVIGSYGRTGNAFHILDTVPDRSYAAGGVRLYADGPGTDFFSQQDALFIRGSWYPEDFGILDTFILGGTGNYEDSDEDYYLWRAAFHSPEASFFPITASVGGYDYKRNIRGHTQEMDYGGFDLSASVDEISVGNSTLMVRAGYRTEDVSLVTGDEHSRALTGIFLLDELPVGREVTLDIGLGLERSSMGGESEVAGHVGAVWHAKDLTVRGRIARAYRFPSLTSMYETMVDMGTYYRNGSPGLDSERTFTFLIDTQKKLPGNITASLTLYRTSIDSYNYLKPTTKTGPDGDPVYRWCDCADAYAEGLTLTLEGGKDLTWRFGYTALDSRDEYWNVPAGYLPRHTFRLGFAGTRGRFSGEIGVEYVMDRVSPDITRTSWQHMDSYLAVNAASVIDLREDLRLSLTLTNIFDAEIDIYENGISSTLPGRTFGAVLEYLF